MSLMQQISDAELDRDIADVTASLRAGRYCGTYAGGRARKFDRAYLEQWLAKVTAEKARRDGERKAEVL